MTTEIFVDHIRDTIRELEAVCRREEREKMLSAVLQVRCGDYADDGLIQGPAMVLAACEDRALAVKAIFKARNPYSMGELADLALGPAEAESDSK